MRSISFAPFAVLLGAVIAGAAPAFARSSEPAAAQHTIIVVNGTKRDIVSVYVSPPNQSEWGDDKLGDDQLPVGHRFNVEVSGGCKQDLRVVFDNKSAEEKREVDICAGNIVNIHPGWTTEGGSPPADGGNDANHIRFVAPVGLGAR